MLSDYHKKEIAVKVGGPKNREVVKSEKEKGVMDRSVVNGMRSGR